MGPEADKRFSNGNSPDLGVNVNFDKLDIVSSKEVFY